MSEKMLDRITPLILTYNEAPNIGRTLEQLMWANDIVIVDSFSNDRTAEIVSGYGPARLIQRPFDSFAAQCNFGLEQTGISTEWVLSLDADYILCPELVAELESLTPGKNVVGFRAKFIYCIHGRRLRSGFYPPVTVLFRKSQAFYRNDGHAHRVVLEGKVENLHAPVLHDDRKSLARWFQAQSRYTELEAIKLLTMDGASLSWTDRIRQWRMLVPLAMLFYCLVFRAGVLDGWAGFYYAFQRSLAELMLSLYLIEHDLGIANPELPIGRSENISRQDAENADIT